MFLIKPGREGDFGQRDKLCREAVWDAGNKKASEHAFRTQPPACLRRHNHKTPASATTRPSPARLAFRPAVCITPRQAAAEASRDRWRLRPGPKPEPDHPPPPHHQGRRAPAETEEEEEEGETGMISHLYKVSRTTPRSWRHVNSPPSVAQRHVLPAPPTFSPAPRPGPLLLTAASSRPARVLLRSPPAVSHSGQERLIISGFT